MKVKFRIPQAFGCIYGAHVPLKIPLINYKDFYNRKQSLSLNVSAVSDSESRFIKVECSRSVRDANVLQIPLFVKSFGLVKLIRFLSICCLDMTHYLFTSLEIMLTQLFPIV